MFLIKGKYYVDALSKLYTTNATRSGFVITDPNNEYYGIEFGEFNINSLSDLNVEHLSYDKFVLYVEDRNYVILYNTLVKNILTQYNILKPFEQDIMLGVHTHLIMDMNINSLITDTIDLDFNLPLGEISIEFLIPILYLSNCRIDRQIKLKLEKFVDIWFNFMVTVSRIKYGKYLIKTDQHDITNCIMIKDDWEIVFQRLIKLTEQQVGVIGDSYHDLVFLRNWMLINKDYNKLVDYVSKNVVRFLSSNNYKYNEWLVEILFKRVNNECHVTFIE